MYVEESIARERVMCHRTIHNGLANASVCIGRTCMAWWFIHPHIAIGYIPESEVHELIKKYKLGTESEPNYLDIPELVNRVGYCGLAQEAYQYRKIGIIRDDE